MLVDLLPADVAYELAGYESTPEEVEVLREQLGLNDPVVERYGRWLSGVFQGDLGVSLMNREPVWQAITARLPEDPVSPTTVCSPVGWLNRVCDSCSCSIGDGTFTAPPRARG